MLNDWSEVVPLGSLALNGLGPKENEIGQNKRIEYSTSLIRFSVTKPTPRRNRKIGLLLTLVPRREKGYRGPRFAKNWATLKFELFLASAQRKYSSLLSEFVLNYHG